MDMNAPYYFVKVVICGSFTEASRVLGVPKSTISDKVAGLEQYLGVTLLTRTTRKLKLTEVGNAYFKQAEQAMGFLQAANEEAVFAQMHPTGTLKITSSADQPTTDVVIESVMEYRRKFPKVRVELDFSDRRVDLIAEGCDIAVRSGQLPDSSLIAKKVGVSRLILISSSKYLRSAPTLKHPKDLSEHKCVGLLNETIGDTWELRTVQGRTARVSITSSISTNSFAALKNLIRSGEGIALIPDVLCKNELRTKELVQVLNEWGTQEIPVQLVYPPQRYSSPKVREMFSILEIGLRKLYKI